MADMICFEEDCKLLQPKNIWTEQLAKIIEKRQAFYMYPLAKKLIQSHFHPLFLSATTNSNDRGRIYFFYGGYHTGKSYLLKYTLVLIKRNYPEIWQIAEAPIIKLDLNNNINTANQLLLYLLAKLGRPINPKTLLHWKKTNLIKERLQGMLIRTLEGCGTRILILDECQKLLQSRNSNITDIFELLKDLSTKTNWNTELRTQIVLCGTKDGIPLLEAADWIQGRTRTIKLQELGRQDFGVFLMRLYRDYISLGVSEKWSLVNKGGESEKWVLNHEMALYIYQRTQGKVGLTVDLIRTAVLSALHDGRLYPEKYDFEDVQLSEKFFIAQPKSAKPITKSSQKKIKLSIQDRTCIIENCSRNHKPYARYASLVYHYKIKHPEINLVYEDDNHDRHN